MKAPRPRFTYEVFAPVSIALVLSTISAILGQPEFAEPIANVTAVIGRNVVLTCTVKELGPYKVAWLRVDTQTILTIQNHMLTRNPRISVSNSGQTTWYLMIKNVKLADEGAYMCQINTDPMKMQVGYLTVVAPPDILDYPTSKDMFLNEGADATLHCAARGMPQPTISWRRENGDQIRPRDRQLALATVASSLSDDGSSLTLARVTRQDMGSYLCIASNGVPPSVSKRIMVIVNFSPHIRAENQLLSAHEGADVTLACRVEAHPKPITYWTKGKDEMIMQSQKYALKSTTSGGYRHHLELTIRNVGKGDFGVYQCVSKNSLGEAELSLKLEEFVNSTALGEGVTKLSQTWLSSATVAYYNQHRRTCIILTATLLFFTLYK